MASIPPPADSDGDLQDTAASYYLVMIASGKVPNVVVGGDLDGLRPPLSGKGLDPADAGGGAHRLPNC